MWNLFSVVEPKVTKPARSLKEDLLHQQAKALEKIQEQAQKILNSITTILKKQAGQKGEKSEDNEGMLEQVEKSITVLHDKLEADNDKFQKYIAHRDQQKTNQQQFFRNCMRCYEVKKSQLNRYIQELQNKVQQLQIKGYKTYQLNPKPNTVLSGINQNYITKCLTKVQQHSKIQQLICQMVQKNRQKQLKEKNYVSTTQFPSQKKEKITLLNTATKCNNLNDLEKQLQMILLKEEIVGEMLDKRIKGCRNRFDRLACQEKLFKEAMKKNGLANEEKRRSSLKLSSFKGSQQETSFSKFPQKRSSFSTAKPNQCQSQPIHLNPSIDDAKLQFAQKREQPSEFNQQVQFQQQDKSKEQNSEEDQIPTENFIDACQYLITERFVEDDEDNEDKLQENEQDEEQIDERG